MKTAYEDKFSILKVGYVASRHRHGHRRCHLCLGAVLLLWPRVYSCLHGVTVPGLISNSRKTPHRGGPTALLKLCRLSARQNFILRAEKLNFIADHHGHGHQLRQAGATHSQGPPAQLNASNIPPVLRVRQEEVTPGGSGSKRLKSRRRAAKDTEFCT